MLKKTVIINTLIIFTISNCLAFIINSSADSIDVSLKVDENILDGMQSNLIIKDSNDDDKYLVDSQKNLFYKWHSLKYTVENKKIHSVATNGNVSVAVGDENLILTSNDRVQWMRVNTDSFKKVFCNFNNVIWTGKMFLAFSNNYNYYISSIDGITWNEVPFGRYYSISNVYLINSKIFIMCSDSVVDEVYAPQAMILVSTDGKTWVRSKFKNIATSMFGTRPLYTIAYNGKFYIAAGNFGSRATSIDGVNWIGIDTSNESYKAYIAKNEELMLQYSAYFVNFKSLIWDGKRFVASGFDNYSSENIPRVMTSTDGVKWKTLSRWDSSYKSGKENFELLWDGKEYVLTITSSERVQPEVFNSQEEIIYFTSISTSRDGIKWNKICEFNSTTYNNIENPTYIFNNKIYLLSESIYIGSKITGDSIPKDASIISMYKPRLVNFPRIAYNLYSNPTGFREMLCPAIDGKPLVYPKDSEPMAYKGSMEGQLEILYPLDIIIEHMNGKLEYDKKTGFYVAKFNNKEKFRIKANYGALILKKKDGSSEFVSMERFNESAPRMYKGKIYVSIRGIMTTLDYEMKFDSDHNGLGYYKINL